MEETLDYVFIRFNSFCEHILYDLLMHRAGNRIKVSDISSRLALTSSVSTSKQFSFSDHEAVVTQFKICLAVQHKHEDTLEDNRDLTLEVIELLRNNLDQVTALQQGICESTL